MRREPGRGLIGRRGFLRGAGAAVGATSLLASGATSRAIGADEPRLKVAAVVTELTYRSHAHVILENFLVPYLFNGKRTDPGAEIVGLYVDQFPRRDMARQLARDYKIPIFPTIAQALCAGGDRLAADAVLSIGEHGDYPVNAKGQREYPRKRFFDEIIAVFEKSGRVVPVFNDKHLSYRWDWASEMADTARRLKVPFMAGSSVPLATRRPSLELPEGFAVKAAVSVHGGPVEAYDFHGLEVLQSMLEARKGGETGVSEVRFLDAEALWPAAEAGLWSPALADAALAAELGAGTPPLRELLRTPRFARVEPHGILLTYRDGLRAIVLKIGNSSTRWDFACQLEGEETPRATSFYVGPWDNRCLFKALSHAIQTHFRERRPPYPLERTLLTTGVLDAAMDSRQRDGRGVETPQLAIAYQPTDYRAMREMGATWKILTPDTPQPRGVDHSGDRGA